MMHRFIIYGFLLLNVMLQGVCAQTELDSLQLLLSSAQADSARLRLNRELAEHLIAQDPVEALVYYEASMELALELDDSAGLCLAYLGVCDVKSIMYAHKSAFNAIQQALRYAADDNELLALCYNRLSVIYFQLEDQKKSFESDLKSLKYNTLRFDTVGMAYDMHNIGTYYMEVQVYDSALFYYQKSNEIVASIDPILPIYNRSRMGLIYARMNRYDDALVFHHEALRAFEAQAMDIDALNEKYYLAETYIYTKNLEQARRYSLEVLAQAKTHKLQSVVQKAYSSLMHISELENDYKQAYAYAQLVNAYADTLNQLNSESLIKTNEARYKYNRQLIELEHSEAKNSLLSKQKNLLMLVVLLVVLIAIGLVIFLIQVHRSHKVNKTLLEELDTANKTKTKLLSIIGHDLRGSVGNLKSFVELLNNKLIAQEAFDRVLPQIVQSVESAYDLLQNLTTWARSNQDNFSPKIEEFATQELLAQVEKQLHTHIQSKGIEVVTEVEVTRMAADRNMVLMIVRNILTNAIKFSPNNSKIVVRITRLDDMVRVAIIDEGVGISPENIAAILDPNVNFHNKGTNDETGSGLGLNLSQSFIQAHGGALSIQSELGKGSTFAFTIPQ